MKIKPVSNVDGQKVAHFGRGGRLAGQEDPIGPESGGNVCQTSGRQRERREGKRRRRSRHQLEDADGTNIDDVRRNLRHVKSVQRH